MADSFFDTTALSQATTAYERLSRFALRPELYFDAAATVKPTRQTHPGSAVRFTIYQELAPKISTLNEITDVEVVSAVDDEVTVSLNEYGNAAASTARIRGFSFLQVAPDVANLIGFNAGISFDSLARNALVAGTNVNYSGNATSRVTIDASDGDTLKARDIREVVALMSDANVQRLGNYYRAFLSPLVSIDLREETGAASWRDPHTYAQPAEIWNGEIGVFEGVAFIETPRLSASNLEAAQGGPGGFLNGGATNEDVHPTIVLGNEALAKTWSAAVSAPRPQIVLGAVVDRLQRIVPVGWYWLGGFGRFREAAIYRIESSSTLTA